MKPQNSIRILSVDDHPVFREGIRTIISSQRDMLLVSQAATAGDALQEFRLHRPDVTLMDLRLPGADGTDTLIAISWRVSRSPHHCFDNSDGDAEIQRSLRAGAIA